MWVIGLTGGIASGKSTVEELLRGHGIPTIDADQVSRRVMRRGQPAYREIVEEFGAGILDRERRIDRRALGRVVYRDAARRRRLEEITHPRIWTAIWKQVSRLERQGEPLVVVSAALMVESGFHTRFDQVVVVSCGPEEQLLRVMDRDGFTREQACRRIEAQMPLSDKVAVADHVIDTSGTKERTAEQVTRLVSRWRQALDPAREPGRGGSGPDGATAPP